MPFHTGKIWFNLSTLWRQDVRVERFTINSCFSATWLTLWWTSNAATVLKRKPSLRTLNKLWREKNLPSTSCLLVFWLGYKLWNNPPRISLIADNTDLLDKTVYELLFETNVPFYLANFLRTWDYRGSYEFRETNQIISSSLIDFLNAFS